MTGWRAVACSGLLLLAVAQAAGALDVVPPPGWSTIGDVETYGADELWELIDGAADQYLAYGFELLERHGFTAGDTAVTIDIYDMGSPLNAFGIFATERSENDERLDIGAETILHAPYQALLLKDRFFVRAEAAAGNLTPAGARHLLEAIAPKLPGETELPGELARLPRRGRLPGTEGFTRGSFRGLGELRHCVHADYAADDGNHYTVFVVLAPARSTEADVWQSLAAKWKPLAGAAAPALKRTIPYEGVVGVVRMDGGILGVVGVEDEGTLVRLLRELAQRE